MHIDSMSFRYAGKIKYIKCLSGLTGCWIRCVFVLLIFSLSAPAGAEDLLGIFSLAVKNDPQIRAAGFIHAASRETLEQAWADVRPRLALTGDFEFTSQNIRNSDNDVYDTGRANFDTQTYGLNLSQILFKYDSFIGISQAKAELVRADAELEMARQELIIRVARAYLDALEARDVVDFTRTEMTAVEKHFEFARERHKMGLAPVTDLYDAKARLAEVAARMVAVENQLDDALEGLRELCGSPVSDPAGLREHMPLVAPEPAAVAPWVEKALSRNPEIQAKRQALEVAVKEVLRQKAGHYPTVDVVGEYSYEDTDGSVFGGGYRLENSALLLRFNLPLYQGGRVASKVREAIELKKKAEEDVTEIQRSIERRIRSAHSGVSSAIKKVEALRESVVAQELALTGKKEGYRSGLFTILAVLDTEQELYEARRDFTLARYDYILNRLLLTQSVGALSETDLFTINQWLN